MLARQDPETIVDTALVALARGPKCRVELDALDVPIYTTDAKGAVTYWNQACVAFAGREPQLGKDRWCVTWRLYTTAGDRLPHHKCPMAQAVREARPIRDAIAIAERPDGSRVAFRPYPTPIFGDDGSLEGAVNLLIDVSAEQSLALQEQAARCRRLANSSYDRWTCKVLGDMADSFGRTAEELARNGAGRDA